MADDNRALNLSEVRGNCARFRDCNRDDCIFFDGDEPCWSRVSPFKLRRRPSLLLKDTAEHCQCLAISCTECELYEE